jgi:hypothetical protein
MKFIAVHHNKYLFLSTNLYKRMEILFLYHVIKYYG